MSSILPSQRDTICSKLRVCPITSLLTPRLLRTPSTSRQTLVSLSNAQPRYQRGPLAPYNASSSSVASEGNPEYFPGGCGVGCFRVCSFRNRDTPSSLMRDG